jgi:hypothetical protein
MPIHAETPQEELWLYLRVCVEGAWLQLRGVGEGVSTLTISPTRRIEIMGDGQPCPGMHTAHCTALSSCTQGQQSAVLSCTQGQHRCIAVLHKEATQCIALLHTGATQVHCFSAHTGNTVHHSSIYTVAIQCIALLHFGQYNASHEENQCVALLLTRMELYCRLNSLGRLRCLAQNMCQFNTFNGCTFVPGNFWKS